MNTKQFSSLFLLGLLLLASPSFAATKKITCSIDYYNSTANRAGEDGPEKTEEINVDSLQFDLEDYRHIYRVKLPNARKTSHLVLKIINKKSKNEVEYHGSVDWDFVHSLSISIPKKEISGQIVDRAQLNCHID